MLMEPDMRQRATVDYGDNLLSEQEQVQPPPPRPMESRATKRPFEEIKMFESSKTECDLQYCTDHADPITAVMMCCERAISYRPHTATMYLRKSYAIQIIQILALHMFVL